MREEDEMIRSPVDGAARSGRTRLVGRRGL